MLAIRHLSEKIERERVGSERLLTVRHFADFIQFAMNSDFGATFNQLLVI